MPLLGVGVLVICLGALLLVGLLAMAHELFCECMLAAPSVSDGEAAGEYTGQEPAASLSAISTDR
jgi:hypothetical protein